MKTEGRFSPLVFTGDGYLTRLPALEESKHETTCQEKKGNPNR